MTKLQEFRAPKTTETANGNGHQDNFHPERQQGTPQTPASGKKTPNSLRTRLLLGILPTVLTPLVVAGIAGFWVIQENLENRSRSRLQEQSLLAGEAMREKLLSLVQTPETLAKNPLVLDAVREGTQQVSAENLMSLSNEELEQRFNDTKLLRVNPTLNQYVQRLTNKESIGEVIITEKNGLNVAYTDISPDVDVVQRDDNWWQSGKQGELAGDLEFDASTAQVLMSIMQRITDPNTGEFLGIAKVGVPRSAFEVVNSYLEQSGLLETGQVQVLNTSENQVLVTVTQQGALVRDRVEGGEVIERASQLLVEAVEDPETLLQEGTQELTNQYNFLAFQSDFYVDKQGNTITRLSFLYQGRFYELTNVPDTDWVAISSVEERVIESIGNELITVFAVVGVILGTAAVGITFLLARQLSNPLINVSQSAQKAAQGDLSARAQPQGSSEAQALAESYNNLVERVQELLKEQQELVEQQQRQREALEEDVSRLMTDIEQAADGDLTVRAQLMEGDIGIVADLFNAVIENLQETAQQVKTAASQVNESLGDNENEIRNLAESAIAEAEEIQKTLTSVEEMNRSIQEVTQNAQKASSIADTAFSTAQAGNQAMDETVASIQGLRSTVGETSKKVKEMGEAAQKISKVVSLIDHISLKTTLLAANASVEAHRAGELGQGFTAVAEQVESLAEQSASAAKEIAQIVTQIQYQTQDAIETMEQGNAAVAESTRSVEDTKARLTEVVERSEEINNLMRSISDSTVSQAETSAMVSRLMIEVAQRSQNRSEVSKEVAEAIQETAQVAKSLETSVEQFKVQK